MHTVFCLLYHKDITFSYLSLLVVEFHHFVADSVMSHSLAALFSLLVVGQLLQCDFLLVMMLITGSADKMATGRGQGS